MIDIDIFKLLPVLLYPDQVLFTLYQSFASVLPSEFCFFDLIISPVDLEPECAELVVNCIELILNFIVFVLCTPKRSFLFLF